MPLDGNLHAERRLYIKISPALACSECRLGGQNMVRNLPFGVQRFRHLKEAGDDVIAVVTVGGKEPVLGEKKRVIAPAPRIPLRAAGGRVGRGRHNDLEVIGGDKLYPEAAWPAVIVDALAVPLATPPPF